MVILSFLSFIYELFQMAHVNFDTKTAVVEAMDQITGYLAGSEYFWKISTNLAPSENTVCMDPYVNMMFAEPGVFLNTSGLQKVADIIQVSSTEHIKGTSLFISTGFWLCSVCPDGVS